MNRILVLLAVLALVLAGQLAYATYLDSSWYARMTNVQTYGDYGLPGMAQSSTHIQVTAGPTFAVRQSGEAPDNEKASWGNMTVDPSHTMGAISFDYETFWTDPNLILNLQSSTIYGPMNQVVWTSANTGLQSGHVYIEGNPNGYYFTLTVVPEPESLATMSTLCAATMLWPKRTCRGSGRRR